MELGNFAFRMLADKVLVFEQKHFEACQLSEESQSLGLLVSCEDVGRSHSLQWMFAHLTMQEALAARFIASRIKVTDVAWLVGILGPLTGHLSTFWRLLAAELNAESVADLISSFIALPHQEISVSPPTTPAGGEDDNTAQITYFLRAKRSDILALADKLSEHLSMTSAERLADLLLDGVVAGYGSTAVKATVADGKDVTGALFMRQLLLLWERRVPQASSDTLCKTVAHIDQSTAARCFPQCRTGDDQRPGKAARTVPLPLVCGG